MKYIRDLLSSLPQLEPIPTGLQPRYSKEKNIRAVIFDIYGTLLISSSGDIDQAVISEENLEKALEISDIEILGDRKSTLNQILKDFEYTIRICHTDSKNHGIPYPEIDILSVWEIVLIQARRKKLVDYDEEANFMRMTCYFEFLSNRVYPMPHLKEVINELRHRKLPLGIVSNAQFYTPVVMNYYLRGKAKLTEKIKGFKSALTIFSYRNGRAKPDTYLFAEIVYALRKKYGISPDEALFVGNDMLKDIYASYQEGFRTVLFAGDKRSLRMREDDKRTKELEPDHIITDLKQLLEIV